MCSIFPVEVISLLGGDQAVVMVGGEKKVVSTALLLEEVTVGDYVTVFFGYARERHAPEVAKEILSFSRQFHSGEYGKQVVQEALPA
ncbi:MAG: HypC/HybG/HupF family hydrogenase formation chaperone [Candidatus Moraniibacteriota bacterium]|nr:MAG: HypC/HybG/HupF family hydrogenase formation chaperone [Candidatus Moranbacteria bacterium]